MVCYVADDRSKDAIRLAFDVRLPRWEPGSPHWLCLVMREKSSGRTLGVTGLIDRSDGVVEVGFLLASAFHSKGLGIESLRAPCRASFTDAGCRKLTAMVTPGNVASKAVREKVGFVQEEPLRKSYLQLATSDRKARMKNPYRCPTAPVGIPSCAPRYVST